MTYANDNLDETFVEADARLVKFRDNRFFQLCLGGVANRDSAFKEILLERFPIEEVNEWMEAASKPAPRSPKERWGMAL